MFFSMNFLGVKIIIVCKSYTQLSGSWVGKRWLNLMYGYFSKKTWLTFVDVDLLSRLKCNPYSNQR